MPRRIALPRGINVGGHRVKMGRLRTLFEELGLSDVATFIASGNVIFSTESTDALERRIEHHLEQALGYEVATFIRSPSELVEVASFQPPEAEDHGAPERSVYVIFLKAPADTDVQERLADVGTPMDEFGFIGREIYWLIRGKLTDSPVFGAGLIKAIGAVPNTMRNITSVRRLVAKHGVDA